MKSARQLNQAMNLRQDIYFALTTTQQRKLSTLGFSSVDLDNMTRKQFSQVTRSKKLMTMFERLEVLNTPIKTNVIYIDFDISQEIEPHEAATHDAGYFFKTKY